MFINFHKSSFILTSWFKLSNINKKLSKFCSAFVVSWHDTETGRNIIFNLKTFIKSSLSLGEQSTQQNTGHNLMTNFCYGRVRNVSKSKVKSSSTFFFLSMKFNNICFGNFSLKSVYFKYSKSGFGFQIITKVL